MSATPESIGKYKIERELGSGASSVVYLAYDAFNRQNVAVKQIHAHLLRDEKQAKVYRKTLRNEALLAGQLRHPYIVRLFDADEDAEPPYLVLEFLDGQSLAAYTPADKLLPVSQVLDIGFKCCSALDHAHSRGLVHRDIKPANIMLQGNGNVKITDFGTALSVRGDATQMVGLVGSPSYMSPEQVREEQVTHHSDMFALGVVLYELLTGRRPFEGDSDFATMYKIGTETPKPPSALRSGLPDEIDSVIARALAKLPQDRYPDWSEFADALLFVNKQIPVKRERDREAERFAQMRTLPFFSGFHDAALWEALRLGTMNNYPAGETLMRENTPGESFLVILDGSVSVSRNGKKLATLPAGTTLGEMCYLQADNKMRTATAMAETEVAALEIRNTSLRQASDDLQSRFDKAFIQLVVSRLIATTQKLDEVTAAEDASDKSKARWIVDKLNTKVF